MRNMINNKLKSKNYLIISFVKKQNIKFELKGNMNKKEKEIKTK